MVYQSQRAHHGMCVTLVIARYIRMPHMYYIGFILIFTNTSETQVYLLLRRKVKALLELKGSKVNIFLQDNNKGELLTITETFFHQ